MVTKIRVQVTEVEFWNLTFSAISYDMFKEKKLI